MIHDIAKLRIGDKVHYHPEHHSKSQWENDMIKEIREDNTSGVWVVYRCDGNWHKFKEYTSALTNLRDLNRGWKF